MIIDELFNGEPESAYFIAEAGVNHNGDLDLAKELIDVATDANADAVKFQTFSAERLVNKKAPTAAYQKEKTGIESQQEMLRQYELDREDHEMLMEYSRENDITFLSTPFDRESADLLVDLGVPAIKISSGDLDNHPLLKHIAEYGLPMIVSTGMGTLDEIQSAYDTITSIKPKIDLIFLHCTSEYPTPVTEVNLRAMQTIDAKLPTPVGYSDHTTLSETPALAVAAGACLVEKHFTIDSSLPGPDHEASLEPDELQQAISLTETVTTALGSEKKMPTVTEQKNMAKSRKGLHAATDIPAGSRIIDEHVDILRPATGLSPRRYDEVVGKRAATDISSGDPIMAADVEDIEEGNS